VDDGEKGSDEAIPAHYESGAARAAYMLGLSVGGLTRRNRQNAQVRDGGRRPCFIDKVNASNFIVAIETAMGTRRSHLPFG
jgi:hypothetical protein